MESGFLAVWQLPSLFAASFFDLSTMAWVLFGAPGAPISPSLLLSPAARVFMVAVPALSGALLFIVADVVMRHRHHPTDDHRTSPRRRRGSRGAGVPPLPSAPGARQRISSGDRGQSA